jgi:hypothetical protein
MQKKKKLFTSLLITLPNITKHSKSAIIKIFDENEKTESEIQNKG